MTSLDCKQTRTLLMAYLDSELDALSTLEVGEHLERCGACRERFDAEQTIERGLRAELLDERMPEAVWQRLTAQVQPAASRPRRVWRLVPLAAAALVLVAVGLLLRDSLWGNTPLPSGSLAAAFVEAHRARLAAPASSAVGQAEPAALQSLLHAAGFDGVSLPTTGMLADHYVEPLEAHDVRFGGVPGLEVSYECCGQPVSVFFVDQRYLDPTSDCETEIRSDGLRGRTHASGGMFVGVVHEHSTPLDDYFTH